MNKLKIFTIIFFILCYSNNSYSKVILITKPEKALSIKSLIKNPQIHNASNNYHCNLINQPKTALINIVCNSIYPSSWNTKTDNYKEISMIKKWDFKNNKTENLFEFLGKDYVLGTFNYSYNGEKALLGYKYKDKKKVMLYNVKNMKLSKELYNFEDESISYPFFSPSDNLIISAAPKSNEIRVYDAKTYKLKNHLKSINFGGSGISEIQIYNDRYIVSVGYDYKINIWDLQKNKAVKTFEGTDPINYSNDKNYFVYCDSALEKNEFKITNLKTKKYQKLDQCSNFIKFSPNNQLIAYTSYNNKLNKDSIKIKKLNDLSKDYKEIIIGVSASDIQSVIFTSDSKNIITSNYGDIKLWKIE